MNTRWTSRHLRILTGPILLGAIVVGSASPVHSMPTARPRQVKVLVITTLEQDAEAFVDHFAMTEKVTVPGLLPSAPAILCNTDDVCELTTGMGKANAAASVAEAIFGGQLDLSKAYFLIAGVAAIDPSQGTVGSVAWASHAVDFAISWEIDARSLPTGWTTGYLGIGTTSPTQVPGLLFGSEVYAISGGLLEEALTLSKGTRLGDNAAAQAVRALYASAPATAPPEVLECDSTSSDTAWGGALLGARATAWTALMTSGAGTYCTSQQEDTATLTALARGGDAGLLDPQRALVLHAGSAFDRPYEGQSAYDAITASNDDVVSLAIDNLVLAAAPLVTDVVTRWSLWEAGVPK
jgi:purine nucleoside permease